eukprot:403335036
MTFFYDINGDGLLQTGSYNKPNVDLQKFIGLALLGIQVVMHFCFIFWFFFMVWKTFLFRFGLLGKLMKREFPILLVVYCLIVDPKYNVITIYNSWVYQIFFWIRHFITLLVFAAGIKAAIYIAHPSYYKPQKWLIS